MSPKMWTPILFILLLQTGLNLADSYNAPKQCGYPGSPAHASVTFSTDTMEPGTIASYVCNNGYELLGPQRRLCNNNGTWTPQGIPFCVLNVAVGKAAMQSSTMSSGGSAQKAVDGSTSSVHSVATCTATAPEVSPWWYVNLLEPYLVQLVRIDFGDMAGLSNMPGMDAAHLGSNQLIVVRVGNTRPDLGTNALCNTYRGHVEPGRPLYLPCTRPMAGAFVSVHIENASNSTLIKRSLSICETFVYTDYALSTEQCPSFRDQPLGSTATYNGKCYLFYHQQPSTFEKARRLCEIRGGTLVDETSPALQGFLSWELYRRHRTDLSGQYWLGVHREPSSNGAESTWHWINGKELKLSFWNLPGSNVPPAPSSNSDLNCARFDGAKGWLWSETNCKSSLNYICQHRPLSCGKPERPTNATILARSVDIGSLIEYRCSPGNLLVGPNVRTCLPNGFFSEFAPKCKYVECGDPAPINKGQYTLINGTKSYLSQVQYTCQTGYILVGRSLLTCDTDSKWNGPPPRCEPVMCPAPEQLPNGYVRALPEGSRFGSRAHYGCLPGFQLHGTNHSLLCSVQGYWLGEVPTCKEIKATTTTSTSTTSTTTQPPPITIDLTKMFTTSSGDSSVPNTHYVATNRTGLEEYGTTRNKLESVWSRIPMSTSAAKQSNSFTSPSTVFTTTEQSATNKLKPSSSTVKPANTVVPSTTGYNLGTSNKNSNNKKIGHANKDTNYHHKIPSIVTKNSEKDNINSLSRKSTSPKAKFNMVGIIALAIFGSFVFLAAIITIVIIVFRRYKHTSSSLDAQTISTLDSNSDQNGFYRNYQKAWENLKFTAANSYKPQNRLDNVDYTFNPLNVSPQHIQQIRTNQANFRTGIYNEEYRDVNEITLNADVAALYTRPDRQAANVRRKF